MVNYASNVQRGTKGGGRKAQLEQELIGNAVERTNEIGSNNGSVQRTNVGSTEHKVTRRRMRHLGIKQGRRLRQKSEMLNWYAASAYRPSQVKSYWQKALDAEHDRYQLPEPYAEYDDNPTSTQYGLVETALQNYTKSKSRLSSQITVGA